MNSRHIQICSLQSHPQLPWKGLWLSISFVQANLKQLKPSSRFVSAPVPFQLYLSFHARQETGIEISAELRSQFIVLHGILKALRSQDIGPALS